MNYSAGTAGTLFECLTSYTDSNGETHKLHDVHLLQLAMVIAEREGVKYVPIGDNKVFFMRPNYDIERRVKDELAKEVEKKKK